MIIVHDKRLPKEAIATLHQYGECLPFYTENRTYEKIAGHPDIFICPIGDKIIVAPNTPQEFITALLSVGLTLEKGTTAVGEKKQNSTAYNVVVADNYIIHNPKFTDPAILNNKGNRKFVPIKQGYARCSLLPLKNDCFLTSDRGIEKDLSKHGLNCLYISPEKIVLHGFPYGFIGGCMGIYRNLVFIIGNLDYHPQGKDLKIFLHSLQYEIVELYDGQLFDGGGLFFLE